jgi:hypothetical protein
VPSADGQQCVPHGQAEAIGRLAAGFEALDHGRHDRALRCFEEVRDTAATPKFFLHWYWRMHAGVGMTRARLQAGDLTSARVEASRLTETLRSTADPNLQALGWEARAQVAIAETNWTDATQSIDSALAALSRIDTTPCAWRVHGTACDLHRKTAHPETAAAHRTLAQRLVSTLANSFEPDEPLRRIFLASPAVRWIYEEALETES